ncbi:hypothetical protein [Solemya velesiana gill symbiont]|uniref:Uncharacterized protein n=1 Tax=Solemya velesiana gill symbiont TaxID=1918948 RepID=A0A1T2KW98_9GAMM|nr:hypothetical protein [Solemya velesiana gill symbiont]OOZ37123.1 hypothetical protein BOW51_03835 [Solemya velesiana gill symbiont]
MRTGIYFYGTSTRGVPFVRYSSQDILAADYNNSLVYLKLSISGYSAWQVSWKEVSEENRFALPRTLQACMTSQVAPVSTGYSFHFD